jgi:hypothetical protein
VLLDRNQLWNSVEKTERKKMLYLHENLKLHFQAS